eukprot:CAMPEP_0195290056 /NCGR_PEP_ID=MMETSP0707-20130614/6068_1 /TAXON_ID=33640 /ORGANISM="Asterionellopsis glacialis, Strain CCMP134" /LENGTH=513 /DNA_ID=CAMNT_0040350127 /DNA_START=270 /DNA_END=1811 /DNA_ORIENTATION=-
MKVSTVAVASLLVLVSPSLLRPSDAFTVLSSKPLSHSSNVRNPVHLGSSSNGKHNDNMEQGDDGSAKIPAIRSNTNRRNRKGSGRRKNNNTNSNKRSSPPKNNNNRNVHIIPNPDEQPIQQTLSGGQSLILAMARGMMVWDSPPPPSKDTTAPEIAQEQSSSSSSSLVPPPPPTTTTTATTLPNVLPRWHPHGGISDVNPSFRTASPVMNNQGYAGVIWRNVRKRNKPTLWRHALRMYEKMKVLEEDTNASALKIKRSNIHHEGALQACAKLGLWREALAIYKEVVEQQQRDGGGGGASTTTTTTAISPLSSSSLSTDAIATTSPSRRRRGQPQVSVTDNMMLSCMYACVRGSKDMDTTETTVEERRLPLDAARALILQIESKHNLPLVARHLNPLAAAYQQLGLIKDASELLQQNLADRTSGSEPEVGQNPLNVNDICAKNKASYALLVKGAVLQGDFSEAVDALTDMTEAGLYPNERNLNAWTEVSERKSKQRNTRGRKKKRDEYWLEQVR